MLGFRGAGRFVAMRSLHEQATKSSLSDRKGGFRV